jgi:hypothetical protein
LKCRLRELDYRHMGASVAAHLALRYQGS